MKLSAQARQLLRHKYVLASAVLALVLVLGSATYYFVEAGGPRLGTVEVTTGDIAADVTGDGTVEPVSNPDLSFVSGGRVSVVNVKVGESVRPGALLASADTGVLAANLAGAEAKLQELEAGPQATDVASAQTAVAQAQQALDNLYASVPSALADAESKAESTLYVDVASLFGPETAQGRSLTFSTGDYYGGTQVGQQYDRIDAGFAGWKSADADLDTASDDARDAALSADIARLRTMRSFYSALGQLLANAAPSDFQSSSALAADQSAVAAASATVNGLVTSLTATQSSLASAKLAVASAEDALNKLDAGTRPEDIAAQQAVVEAARAQLAQAEIIAPFAGTVASVSVKPGDVVAANTPAIALVPSGSFQVEVYVSEIDVTKLAVGDPADVTLDAYGAGRSFPASVSAVDAAPSVAPGGGTGYKATLVFSEADPAIAVGMHAHAVIHAGAKQGVLVVPRSALIQQGTQYYVLRQTAKGSVLAPVTVGLVGSDSAEIVSGLSAGDRVVRAGTQ